MALGQTIRELRHDRGLSQEELGLKSGVHRNYIGGLERSERRPSVVTVKRLADGLDVRASELVAAAERRL